MSENTPKTLFGEIRALLDQGPEHWDDVMILLDHHAPLSPEILDQVLPYLEGHTRRWPAHACQPRQDCSLKALQGASWRPLIRALALHRDTYMSGTLRHLETWGRALPGLTWVSLSGWEHEFGLKEAMALARHMRGVEHLELTDSGLEDASLKRWLEEASVSRLRVLDLEGNALTDASVEVLENSGVLEGLEYLGLARNQLSPDGVESLEEILVEAGVEEYDLSENALEVEALSWRQWRDEGTTQEFERWGTWDRSSE